MNKKELYLKLDDEVFIEKTLQQLQREFLKVGLDYSYTMIFGYQELLKKLSDDLTLLFEQEQQLFKQLLYGIDLPEKEVSTILLTSAQPMLDLADLVAIRCAEKVYLRMVFSRGENI